MSRMYDALKRGLSKEVGVDRAGGQPIVAGDTAFRWSGRQEDYQRVIHALLVPSRKDGPQAVLVVSAVHGEGASTVARNLGRWLAESGTVLLVDANLRSPSQHLVFGVPPEAGFSELASGVTDLTRVIKTSPVPGLSLLTCGRIAEGSKRFDWSACDDALKKLRARFDRIVIDGSPVTVYPDAVELASLSDGVILVLEAERTRWEVAGQAKRTLEQGGRPLLGAVLNRRKYHIPEWIYERL